MDEDYYGDGTAVHESWRTGAFTAVALAVGFIIGCKFIVSEKGSVGPDAEVRVDVGVQTEPQQQQEQQQQYSGGIIVIDPPALADVMKRVATAVPGNVRTRRGVLRWASLVWTDYPATLHAPLLDLLHTFELAFPLRNTQGQPLGASVIVPMLGGMDDALQGRDLDGERERAVREDGATQLFVHFKACALGGGGGAARFPPDIVGRLLVRLHLFAMRGGGDGGSCGGAWQGGCILGYTDNTALLQVQNLGVHGDVLDLTVWGVYPATLRNIVYRAVKLLVDENYPGIVLKERR